ncbi:helix-turn-helix domain-containing protein [Dysgonomonas macrotermitis]|nr:helix-turn-helix domain-containing protein [Dysgonomonas macrotermitis]
MNKIYQIRIKELVNTEPVHIQEHQVIEEGKETDKEKYDKIYQNIIRYFEKTKPYCDSEFTISQLAIVLNTNVTYISKAIKIKEGVNFNVFINTHRVNKVKNMLQDDYHNKYTMRHIYTSSGFKHQSTFNKVFKQTEGITPSEYIKKLESDKN